MVKPGRPIPDGLVARTGERILRIVIPSHVDRHGVLHETAVLHKVVESQEWAADGGSEASGFRSRLADHLRAADLTTAAAQRFIRRAADEPSTSTNSSSAVRIIAPSPRAAVAGASASEIGGGGFVMAPSPRSQAAPDADVARDPSLPFPSPAAVAAATPGAIREQQGANLANILRNARLPDTEDGSDLGDATGAPQNLLPPSLSAPSFTNGQAEIVARKQPGFDLAETAEAATRLDEMTDSVISGLEKRTHSDATDTIVPAFPLAPVSGVPQ